MKYVECVDVEGKKYKVPVSKLQWRPSVYGVVIKDGKILLSKQFGDKYDLPGGGVDLGENLELAVVREVKEETGIAVNNPKLLNVAESYFADRHAIVGENYHSILFYYECTFVGGEISTDGFDKWEKNYADKAEWIDLKKINELKVASSVDYRPFIKKAFC